MDGVSMPDVLAADGRAGGGGGRVAAAGRERKACLVGMGKGPWSPTIWVGRVV